MEFEEFDALLAEVRARRVGQAPSPDIKLFDFWTASDEDLARAESALGSQLPARYKEFMRRYGGGQFLFVDLLPVISPDGRAEDVLTVNQDLSVGDFVAVAPVGTGDWWGFASENGVCEERVSFLDHEDGSIQEEASDFLEFVASRGLRHGR
jgi:hypothetical protein